MQKKAPSISL